MYTFIIIFLAACLIVYFGIAFIFYRAMIANRNDEKTGGAKPQASRTAPRMEQLSAREAGVYHVLPVQENGILYSLTSARMDGNVGEVHHAIASDTSGKELWKTQFYSREYIPHLETDVQNIFIVDLYISGQHVCIKPEHGSMITIDKLTGQIITQ
jgi:hypothetical protein